MSAYLLMGTNKITLLERSDIVEKPSRPSYIFFRIGIFVLIQERNYVLEFWVYWPM